MKSVIPIEKLLRWRLAQAEAEAPPAPRAAALLARSRPWWELWPEQFRASWERLARMQVAYGHAMVEPHDSRAGHPVPVLIVRAVEEAEAFARILYLHVRDGRLRLRFVLETPLRLAETAPDVTIVSETDARPLFSARASRSAENEYRLDAELRPEIAARFQGLKVTDRMPFRFVLHATQREE